MRWKCRSNVTMSTQAAAAVCHDSKQTHNSVQAHTVTVISGLLILSPKVVSLNVSQQVRIIN